MRSIEEAFAREGYVSIPFVLNGAGHPLVKAVLPGNVHINILLDTDASANLLDHDLAKELGLNLTDTGEKGGSAGGFIDGIFSIEAFTLEIGGHSFSFDTFLAMDFSSIQQSLDSSGVTEAIHGILGFGFFQKTKCFIDYHSNRLFVDLNHF